MVNNNIEVRAQKELTFKETLDFCLSSIKHRFFRSILTLAVVVLAVAFFMYLLTENFFRDSLRQGVGKEIKIARKSTLQLNMFFTQTTVYEFASMLASASKDEDLMQQLANITKTDKSKIARFTELAMIEKTYYKFFKKMKLGQRKLLIGRRSGDDIFIYLNNQVNYQTFCDNLAPMGNLKLPGGYERLESFVKDYKSYMSGRDKLHATWNKVIGNLQDNVKKVIGDKTLKDFLAETEDSQKVESIYSLITNAGFILSHKDFEAIIAEMKDDKLKEKIIFVLNKQKIRQEWRGIYKGKYKKISEKLSLLDAPPVVKLLKEDFKYEELHKVASTIRYRELLMDLEKKLDFRLVDSISGLSNRDIYLLALSFIVCMVGIANAMLMSITERFREIATLKCLGATDRFILVQITIEAALQGFVGGVLGVIIGLVITLLKDTIIFGGRLYMYFPISGVIISMIVSLLAGVMLSVFASIYPAWKAAKMAPMEAMRVE